MWRKRGACVRISPSFLLLMAVFIWAECIHLLLPLAGLYCLRLWPGAGGIVVTLLYFLGNLPFVLIQRYNRPRLQRLCALQQRTGGKREATA